MIPSLECPGAQTRPLAATAGAALGKGCERGDMPQPGGPVQSSFPCPPAHRLDKTSRRCVDPTRVLAGTDCGFETFIRWSQVDPDVAWLKLRSLSEGAEIASQEL